MCSYKQTATFKYFYLARRGDHQEDLKPKTKKTEIRIDKL